MIELLEQAAELQRFIDARGWRSCIIGGIANLRWGEPRLTRDVDVTLLTGFGNEEAFVGPVLERYAPRIPDAHEFALVNRVVLARGSGGIPIDIALGGLPFEEGLVGRATEFTFGPGLVLRTASAEDLIVLKAFANRSHDWTDIAGVLTRQADHLDWNAIQERLAPLVALKEAPEILDRLERERRQ